MSWLDGIRKWFGKKESGPGARGACVVDGVTLGNARGGRIPPRDTLNLLGRVARFAGREKLSVRVVLEGESLRSAPDGEEFQGVKVLYEKDAAARRSLVARLAREGGGTLVVTQDPELTRQVLASGGEVLRASTFRKVMDGEGGGERDRGGDRGGDRGRPGRRRPDRRPAPAEAGPGKPPAPREGGEGRPEPRNGGNGPSSVRDLVDLVE